LLKISVINNTAKVDKQSKVRSCELPHLLGREPALHHLVDGLCDRLSAPSASSILVCYSLGSDVHFCLIKRTDQGICHIRGTGLVVQPRLSDREAAGANAETSAYPRVDCRASRLRDSLPHKNHMAATLPGAPACLRLLWPLRLAPVEEQERCHLLEAGVPIRAT
jgi:hypothetical protein